MFPIVLLNTNCLKRHWASWKILGWVYAFYNFNEPHNSRYIQFRMFYQYCRYRKFDQYWVCIVIMSYWPLHCTLYITFIDIMNIAKQILHQFYIVSLYLVYIKHLVYIDKEDIAMFSHIEWHWVYIVPLLPCLHRRQRWQSNAAGQNQIDIELYSYPLVYIANLVNIEWHHVYIVPFPSFSHCRHRNVGKHRVYMESHRIPIILFSWST